jgi:hypothetical protein
MLNNTDLKQEELVMDNTNEVADRSGMAIEKVLWKKFILKNVLIYVLTNVFFNSVIPYNSFEDPRAVHLFSGTYCIARFLLPLAFFIPLLVTIDTGNKIQALFKKRVPDFELPAGFRYKKFILKQSLLNSSLTFILTLGFMAVLHFSLPEGYTFRGLLICIIMGIYAGTVALYFMKRTIRHLKVAEVVRVAD